MLRNEAATRAVAAELSTVLKAGDIVALDGTLGAGKTAFARALINAMPGVVEDVPSPTFTLVQTYQRGDAEIWHFDLYRLEVPEDAFELGIEDAFADAISLIEWPDKLGGYLPSRHLRITLAQDGESDTRTLEIIGDATWRDRLADLKNMDILSG
ncbi:tRNA (adenosine(37)-N6)-threonylcarbamoyltransferase complex ATPase subunit type 1 TsaE [Rhodospirillales bacterium]|nr:tRNA (adenosine(37)-N6)-threonylcarbamoyltransferase complex ATPase subunit type 1 TsaE [Rhodospirillales bacterium]